MTIRNLDELSYRDLKARAAREGKTIGLAVNEAIRAYLAGPGARRGDRVLVIYGAGHVPILRQLVADSPHFCVEDPLGYLPAP